MAERVTTPYRRLFEIRLLHHYWLDDGPTVFDALPAPKRDAQLLTYDVRPLLDIQPTAATEATLRGAGCVFRTTALGLVVAAPAGATIAADSELAFIVSLTDSRLLDYTALTLQPSTISELADPDDTSVTRRTYRYKANVPVLSNLTGSSRVSGAEQQLFLSREIPPMAADDRAEALITSGTALMQLNGDNPGATTRSLGEIADLPVYLNQADSPPIVAPPGIVGAPARGVELSGEVPDDVFVLIRLRAVRADDDAFSFVTANGAPRPSAPVYQIRLRNRATIRRYFDQQSGALKNSDATPSVLTHLGNAGAGRKPSRGVVKVDRSNGRITDIVSEIFV